MRKGLVASMLMAALLVAQSTTLASAQGDGRDTNVDFFRGVRTFQLFPRREVPKVEGPQRAYSPKRRYAVPRATPRPTPSETENPTASPPPETGPIRRVVVLGDSLAEALADGLTAFYSERASVRVLRKTRGASGIVRDDFFDWRKGMQEVVEGPETPDAIVVLVGLNDRQILRDQTGTHEPFSEGWRASYARRVDRMLEIAGARRIPVYWVGLPVVRGEKLAGDLAAINEMVRDRLTAAGADLVDVWEAFATVQGEYAASGPDVDGEVTRLRTADGIHFTEAGALKLAFFVDKALQRILDRAPSADEAAVLAALPDINDQIRRENDKSKGVDFAVPIEPPDGLIIPIIAPRPVAGEVRRLTLPPTAPDGALASRRRGGADPIADLVFTLGVPPFARPGRADDFTWRRN